MPSTPSSSEQDHDFQSSQDIAAQPGLADDEKSALLGKLKIDIENQLNAESEGMSASHPIGAAAGGDLPEQLRLVSDAIRPKTDAEWMQDAIALAKSKGTQPADTPIAAIIVLDGKMLAGEINQTAANNDATAHAEILAYRAAGKANGNMELRGATLYSTLQPCGMCTMASIWAKVGRIVYGAGREDVHKMYFENRNLDTMDFISDAYRDDLELIGGVCRDECAQLYYAPNDNVPEDRQGNI